NQRACRALPRGDTGSGAIDPKRPTHFRTSRRDTLAGASGGRTGSREHASTIDKYQPYIHKETEMRKRYWYRLACLSFLVAVLSLPGCKKNVAAAPQVPPPVEPAPASPPPAPVITLRAAPAAIDRGQSTSLEWEAKNATSVRIQPEVGNVQLQGSRSIAPASSVTYTATATGPGGSASDTVRVTVRVPAAAAPARPEPRPEARA